MEEKVRILIVEDEGIVALSLEDTLVQEGYHVIGVADSGKEALEFIQREQIDLVLLDIQINGDWDGIETARKIMAVKDIPFIYLTAFSDDETLARAKETNPAAYLLKPYQAKNMLITIDLALNNFAFRRVPAAKVVPMEKITDQKEAILYYNDAVFIKQNYRYIKVNLEFICYLEAEGNHTAIFTQDRKYVIRHTLNTMLEKLNQQTFIRVHRSFAVNLQHIETFNESTICISRKEIPIGRHYKETFFRHFDFL